MKWTFLLVIPLIGGNPFLNFLGTTAAGEHDSSQAEVSFEFVG